MRVLRSPWVCTGVAEFRSRGGVSGFSKRYLSSRQSCWGLGGQGPGRPKEREDVRGAAFIRRKTGEPLAGTYLTAWRRLETFLATDVPLAWLYRVAAGQLANQRRSTRRFTALQVRLFQVAPPDVDGDPADSAVYGEQQDGIVAALATLRAADQELLAFEELSPAEIASAWGLPARLVRIRLHRARRRLHTALQDHDNGTAVGNGEPAAGHKQARPTRDGLAQQEPEQLSDEEYASKRSQALDDI